MTFFVVTDLIFLFRVALGQIRHRVKLAGPLIETCGKQQISLVGRCVAKYVINCRRINRLHQPTIRDTKVLRKVYISVPRHNLHREATKISQ